MVDFSCFRRVDSIGETVFPKDSFLDFFIERKSFVELMIVVCDWRVTGLEIGYHLEIEANISRLFSYNFTVIFLDIGVDRDLTINFGYKILGS